ncbi:MAG: hypothetical protein NC111_05530 [Bacteroides sp.]|nr:hypothetical protein [Bacteroides sp.]MCM1413344.1 hypothetical protein [Bacteroides sp.]MCM1471970.1 hypothetical protein [Bacteroides sp.]
MPIERFDRAVASYAASSSVARDSMLKVYAPAIDVMKRIVGIDNADSAMLIISNSQVVSVFQPDIENRLPDLTLVESAIGKLRSHWMELCGNEGFPRRIFSIQTPYDQSIIISDTIAMVALNHYLGADYEGYNGFDDYRRALKTPDRIPYDLAEAMLRIKYPFADVDAPTVASQIAYEGAIVSAVQSLMDDDTAEGALGYNKDQMLWVLENESQVWKRMVSENMVYSHDGGVAQRLIMPAPYTSVISRESPGRLGRFVGYEMVRNYLNKNSGVSAIDILRDGIYNRDDFVVASGYSGR